MPRIKKGIDYLPAELRAKVLALENFNSEDWAGFKVGSKVLIDTVDLISDCNIIGYFIGVWGSGKTPLSFFPTAYGYVGNATGLERIVSSRSIRKVG